MRLLPLVLCLFSCIPQTNPDRTVALVLGPEPRHVFIVRKSEAEEEYRRLTELARRRPLDERVRKYLAAYTIALGTLPEAESLPPNGTRQFLDNEIRRGVRKPLQGRQN